MAIVELPTAAVDSRDRPPSAEIRDWPKVVALWAAAVGTQALILLLLTQYGNNYIQSSKLQVIASLLRDGKVNDAKTAASRNFQSAFPTELLVHFALLGVAVVLLAWVGRRALALALPFLLGIVSMSPSFSDDGSITPKPISEFYNSWNWQLLQMEPTGTVLPKIWPSLLRLAVQTALLLLPLIAAPHRRSTTSPASAARTAVLPTLTVMVLALATLQYSTIAELYWMPAVATPLPLPAAGPPTRHRSGSRAHQGTSPRSPRQSSAVHRWRGRRTPTAEIPKEIDPIMFRALIAHERSRA